MRAVDIKIKFLTSNNNFLQEKCLETQNNKAKKGKEEDEKMNKNAACKPNVARTG